MPTCSLPIFLLKGQSTSILGSQAITVPVPLPQMSDCIGVGPLAERFAKDLNLSEGRSATNAEPSIEQSTPLEQPTADTGPGPVHSSSAALDDPKAENDIDSGKEGEASGFSS